MTICSLIVGVLSLLYVLAFALFVVGNFGLFGVEADPLAGVFLIPLGFPWNRFIDAFPQPVWPWLAAAAPLVNLLILQATCRVLGRQRR